MARSRARAIREVAIREVVVLDVAGRLTDVVEDLDQAIQLALAEGPRGVVCDLTGALESHPQPSTEPDAVALLATAGRHARDWPGIPVAVACPDRAVRERLLKHPLGAHLIVAESTFSALSAVLATPSPDVQRLRLSAHPTAARAARRFVTRTLADWLLDGLIPAAAMVAGELVASSTIHAGTDIDLSIALSSGAVRLTVRDHGPALPGQVPSVIDLHGRGLPVADLPWSLGFLPTADGGKVVWAVSDAPRSRIASKSGTLDSQAETVKQLHPAAPMPGGNP